MIFGHFDFDLHAYIWCIWCIVHSILYYYIILKMRFILLYVDFSFMAYFPLKTIFFDDAELPKCISLWLAQEPSPH